MSGSVVSPLQLKSKLLLFWSCHFALLVNSQTQRETHHRAGTPASNSLNRIEEQNLMQSIVCCGPMTHTVTELCGQ